MKETWVIKIGSSLVTKGSAGLNTKNIKAWASQINELINNNINVILVSSGAIAAGMGRLGLSRRPTTSSQLQALAAIGQMNLVQAYEVAFKKYNILTAQMLLTHEDLSNRKRYLNAKNTLNNLVKYNVIPIVNENDTVSTDEIKFGDNDTLASLVANLCDAKSLVILTDQDGLYTDDPKKNKNTKLIKNISVKDKNLNSYARPSNNNLGRGGMVTKVLAAKKAAKSNTRTIICNGSKKDILIKILEKNSSIGTTITNENMAVKSKKQWIANSLKIKGNIFVDTGAAKIIKKSGKSLLPVGIKSISGNFQKGDLVAVCDSKKVEIACGLTNYDSKQLKKIIGKTTSEIRKEQSMFDSDVVIHTDNMILSQY
jgi:glutamate 5-kinase